MNDESEPRTLGDQVARQLKRLREAQRLPYTELSERLAALGRPIPVLGLRRIEKGERRVDVDELAALGLALGVPPLLLVFPVTTEDVVEVVPEWAIRTWDAARWFTGEARHLPYDRKSRHPWGTGGERATAYWVSALPLIHLREHDEFIKRYGAANSAGDQDQVAVVVEDWRRAREEIRKQGFEPPVMQGLLADIEDM